MAKDEETTDAPESGEEMKDEKDTEDSAESDSCMENVDIREMDEEEGEVGSEAENEEEKMDFNENPDQLGDGEVEESEEKADDMSETTASAQSDSGAGLSEAQMTQVSIGEKEAISEEREGNDGADSEKREQTSEMAGGSDDNWKKLENKSANPSLEKECGKKSTPRTERTLGDPEEEWKRNVDLGQSDEIDKESSAEAVDSAFWSHSLSESGVQALDGGTVDEAMSQHLGEIDPSVPAEDLKDGPENEVLEIVITLTKPV